MCILKDQIMYGIDTQMYTTILEYRIKRTNVYNEIKNKQPSILDAISVLKVAQSSMLKSNWSPLPRHSMNIRVSTSQSPECDACCGTSVRRQIVSKSSFGSNLMSSQYLDWAMMAGRYQYGPVDSSERSWVVMKLFDELYTLSLHAPKSSSPHSQCWLSKLIGIYTYTDSRTESMFNLMIQVEFTLQKN